MLGKIDKQSALLACGGSMLGIVVGTEWVLAGPSVYIHEVAGHIWLGGHLVRDYLPHQLPTYQINAFEAFKALADATGPVNLAKRLYHWQIGHLFKNDGVAGWARVTKGTPNALGRALGAKGLRAWTSLSGSVPALAINSTLAIIAARKRRKRPFLASFLTFFALLDHSMASAYTWDAVIRSTTKLAQLGKKGHDFARFATLLGEITGRSPRLIAVATACLYTFPTVVIAAVTERVGFEPTVRD